MTNRFQLATHTLRDVRTLNRTTPVPQAGARARRSGRTRSASPNF